MKDSATDSDSPDDQSLGKAANHPVLTESTDSSNQTLDRVRDILFGQFAESQSRKFDTLQQTLLNQLDQHIASVNNRVTALEESMDNQRVSTQQSDAQFREQLKTSIVKANVELVRSQEMVQSQLAELERTLSRQSVNKKSMAKMLNDIARNLGDGSP